MDGHTEILKMNLEGFRKPSTHILEIGIGHERSSVALQPGHLHINSLGGPGARMLWNCETSSEMFGGWSHWELCQTASRDHHRSPSGLTMELSWPQALGRFSAIPELHGRLEEEDLRPTDARKSTHSSLSEGRSILKRYQGFGGMLRSLGAFRFSETG